ncbi:MAG: hypothetical protein ACRD3C_17825 [Vicinamibacterales bacterium]
MPMTTLITSTPPRGRARWGPRIVAVALLTGVSSLGSTLVSAQQARAEGLDRSWKDAGGVKAALYHWANHMGMLRELEEHDLIATLEFLATGTVSVGGQPCTLTRYRAEINYQMSGMRADFACRLPSGQNHEEIQVVGGQYAWNEVGGTGAGLVPGRGTAVSMPAAYDERAIRLWSNPQGALKSAVMGGANTKVGMEGGKTVVTYPIPGVPGAMARATLTSGPVEGVCTRNCAERIEVRHGNVVTEFTYSKYADYNDPEEQLDAFFAGRIVEKRGTDTVLDLTVTRTNTPNLYIVVPVPPSVRGEKR